MFVIELRLLMTFKNLLMSKSSQSFNKQEKEKKRHKKKQEKAAQKEHRRANSSKGDGLDGMMAYVDEFGNIVDTPPDPESKFEANEEDIQVSVPKDDNYVEEPTARQGKVEFFNEAKGFGFIVDLQDRQKYFVHINNVHGDDLRQHDKVTFEIQEAEKGPMAVDVRIV
jgi:cold shock CspA family protein